MYLFANETNKWTELFKANLESLHWAKKRNNCRLGYSVLDKVLLDTPKSSRKLKYTRTVWNAWTQLRKKLYYRKKEVIIPNHWSIGDFLPLLSWIRNLTRPQQKQITYIYGRLHIQTTENLWDKKANKWRDFTLDISQL
jgi:hypothetical protein